MTFLSHPQPRDSGDYQHRTLWPATALGTRCRTVAVQTTHPEALSAALNTNLLVVEMIADVDVLDIMAFRRSVGLPTVYEISDDFSAFPVGSKLETFYMQPEIRNLIEQMAGLADLLQFSSPYLENKYAALNVNRVVFMNQMLEVPPLRERTPTERCRVGWAASGSHLEDAEELARLLAEVTAMGKLDFELVLMISPEMAACFEKHGLRPTIRPTATMSEYLKFLDTLDIGIAYISKGDFAQGRSDGKYLEYASRGVVSLCSRNGTYQYTVEEDKTGYLFSGAHELFGRLKTLVENRSLREQIRLSAHEDLLCRRNHAAAAVHREVCYTSLVEKRPSISKKASPLSPPNGFLHAVHPLEDELYEILELHNRGVDVQLLHRYFRFIQRESRSLLAWKGLWLLYRQLGLWENLGAIEQGIERCRFEIFGAPPVAAVHPVEGEHSGRLRPFQHGPR